MCARSRADSLKNTVAQPQSAANGLFHQVHAFDGDFALLVGSGFGEGAPQLLHARVLAAVDAPQAIVEFGRKSHRSVKPASIVHRGSLPNRTSREAAYVIICCVAVPRSDVLRFAPQPAYEERDIGCVPKSSRSIVKSRKPRLVTYAAEKIRAGEVLGMPTDTFYGLAVDPFNLHAVDRVYEIKTRSRHKPLSLLIESVDQAAELAWPVPEIFYLLARRFWPGPLTIIVKADPKLPLKVTANTGNVALRVPAAEVPLAIIRSAGLPITATSANLHGEVGMHDGDAGARSAGRLPVDHRRRRPVSSRHALDHRRLDQRRWQLAAAASWRDPRGTDHRAFGTGVDRTRQFRQRKFHPVRWIVALVILGVWDFCSTSAPDHARGGRR